VNRLELEGFSANDKNKSPLSTMTHMQTKAYITIVLMALLISGIIHVAAAQDIVAGVKPSDEFTYNITGIYPTNNPALFIPQEVIDAHETAYFKVLIDAVSGPKVNYTWSWYFSNGSNPLSQSDMVDLETTENTGPFWAIVSANLTTQGRIHPHFGPDLSVFNETVKYAYTNYTRDANRLQLEFAYQNNVTGATCVESTDTYFDKLTGMLVELNDQSVYQNPSYTTIITWKLAGTNAWSSSSIGSRPTEPFFTLPVITAIVIVAAVLVAGLAVFAVSNQRRKARQKAILRKK
jgi:hypothetical protein